MRDPNIVSEADLAHCAATLRDGSRTFFAASLVLPRSVREPAIALYAFCRAADDAVDLASGGRLDALARLRERLNCVYDQRPLPIAADRALAEVVTHFAIPKTLLEALLEGFEWDAVGRRYDDLSTLNDYAARVAGSVGAMMAMLMNVRDADTVARACDLGVAMQLTNIARDVGEDARAGRLYLPREWLKAAHIDPDAWLARPVFSPQLGAVIQRLLVTADALYDRAAAGIARLPVACRPGMNAARLLYAEIGREVERLGYDSVSRRAVVPASRKARLLSRALAATPFLKSRESTPVLAETGFLVDAVAAAVPRIPKRHMQTRVRRRDVRARLISVIDLIERLERRDRVVRVNART